jgi:hypothetical protein
VLLFVVAVSAWFVGSVRLSRNADPDVREFAYAGAAFALVFLIVAATDNAIDFYSNFSQYLGFVVACAVIAHTETQQTAAES